MIIFGNKFKGFFELIERNLRGLRFYIFQMGVELGNIVLWLLFRFSLFYQIGWIGINSFFISGFSGLFVFCVGKV